MHGMSLSPPTSEVIVGTPHAMPSRALSDVPSVKRLGTRFRIDEEYIPGISSRAAAPQNKTFCSIWSSRVSCRQYSSYCLTQVEPTITNFKSEYVLRTCANALMAM